MAWGSLIVTLLDDIEADIAEVFLDVALGFAQNATTSGATTIMGIFFRDYFAANPGGQVNIESSEPVFRVATSDATGLAQGSALTIGATGFIVVEEKPDGTGFTDLRLMLS